MRSQKAWFVFSKTKVMISHKTRAMNSSGWKETDAHFQNTLIFYIKVSLSRVPSVIAVLLYAWTFDNIDGRGIPKSDFPKGLSHPYLICVFITFRVICILTSHMKVIFYNNFTSVHMPIYQPFECSKIDGDFARHFEWRHPGKKITLSRR